MKQWLVGSSLLLGIVLLLGAAYSAFSQDPRGELGGQQQGGGMRGMPNGMPPMHQLHQMKAGTQGLFLLQGSTLRKYSTTLQAQGTLDLSDTTAAAGGHPHPGTFLLAGDDVVVVTDSTFYRVDGKTMKVAVKKALPEATQSTQTANGQQQQQPQRPMPPADLELNNHTLYLMRGPSLVALSIDDGSVLGKATLPKPANAPPADAPPPMDAPPMGAPPDAQQ